MYPDPSSEKFQRAQENMRRYSALLLRIYSRLRAESQLTNGQEDDKSEAEDVN